MPGPLRKILQLSAAGNMLNPILRDQLLYLRGRGLEVHLASVDGALPRRLQDEDGFPFTPLPLTRALDPWGDGRAIEFVRSFCRREAFDLVHTHTPKGHFVGGWGARKAGVPYLVQTVHGLYAHDGMPWWRRWLWQGVEAFSLKDADLVFSQNREDLATLAASPFTRAERLRWLGNGIDLALFRPGLLAGAERAAYRAALGLPPDALVVGMAGRFVAEKGFPEFIEAGQRLLRRHARLHLLAVGLRLADERPAGVWTLAEVDPTLRERITLLENRTDMPKLFACMDVHALPSHREGFPRVLMEGAASGLPQVATEICGCRCCIAHGENGYLVPPRQPRALEAALERLIDDSELRARLGVEARKKAELEFDQRLVFERVWSAYQRLAEHT
jgi:glycosyltransferase involved in cell wall biosynthesis